MDNGLLPTGLDSGALKQQAYGATNAATNMETSAPSMLSQLKQNLVGIFAKDNPIIGARNTALQDYLSTAGNARVSTLSPNLPMVEGRNLALSPTQQDAITSSRLAASLAPLAGYNEILKGMYGNIGDLVSGAGNIYETSINAANRRAGNLIDLYKTATADEQSRRSSGGMGEDISSILASLFGQQQATTQPTENIDDIFGSNTQQPQQPQGNPLNQAFQQAGQQVQERGAIPAAASGLGSLISRVPQLLGAILQNQREGANLVGTGLFGQGFSTGQPQQQGWLARKLGIPLPGEQ